jgi:1,4-dihydroxy-2-naphthoate octaprenyltransferase
VWHAIRLSVGRLTRASSASRTLQPSKKPKNDLMTTRDGARRGHQIAVDNAHEAKLSLSIRVGRHARRPLFLRYSRAVVHGWFARSWAIVKLGRPHYLLSGFALHALGTALAVISGAALHWQVWGLGALVIATAQSMTHYSNDYFDLAADIANRTPTTWSGGSRVLPSGAVRPDVALLVARVLLVLSLAASVLLALSARDKPLILPQCLLIIALAWSYSAPPLRLLTRGLGEATTALVVTLLTPLLGYYAQRGFFQTLPFLACAPLCGLQFAMLLTIELPDEAGDATAGKRSLIVRRGARWGARVCAALVLASFGILPLLFWLGLPWPIATLAALPAPLAIWHGARLLRGAFRVPQRWDSLAWCSVILLMATTFTELAGALLVLRAR